MIYVGGTQLFMNGNGDSWSNEIVWHDPPPTNYNYFASTGGILTNVPIAEYQQTVNMSFNMGSTQHRSFPDIAMVARDILGIWTDVPTNGPVMKGVSGGAIGTSAASPLWAGYAALINQQAALQDKPSVGFLLPALYEIGVGPTYTNCLHDITNGNNIWYDSVTMTGSPNQFYATNGYDLCTGWGTPTGTNLINALVAYSSPIFVDFNYTGSLPAGLAGSILYPWKTLAEGTNAVSTGGTIFIINGGSSSETMTISKAMTITAQHGSASIGN